MDNKQKFLISFVQYDEQSQQNIIDYEQILAYLGKFFFY